MYDWHWGWGWGMGLSMILFWALIIVAIVALVRWLNGRDRAGDDQRSEKPLDVLKRRYARGEIDKEEFHERKRVLQE
jgi:putative membrane protein